jgi:glucan biosynthesis protein C
VNDGPSQERLHALDALRGVAMLLGVVFHASLPFMHGTVLGAFPALRTEVTLWLAIDREADPAYDLLNYVIHAFRMPTFFLLAGLFAHHVYVRHGAREFLERRARRVLVPFVAALLTISTRTSRTARSPRAGDWSCCHCTSGSWSICSSTTC